jgi:serine/threonine-protein kinase
MAPEESIKGATVDERSTVFTLGRAAFVLLSRRAAGEQDRHLWRAGDALFQVATTATRPNPADRYQSVADLTGAWQQAQGGQRPRPG